MSVHIVIPLKRATHGKTRLARALDPAQRAQLVRLMLAQVVGAAVGAPGVERVHLLTSEPDLVPRECARIPDRGGGLNSALAQAARELRARGAERMLIVHADLPYLTPTDVDALVSAAREDALVAAPDWTGAGTNALGFALSRPFTTRFGPGSLAAHRLAAQAARMPFLLVQRAGLADDIDEPAQLDSLVARGGPAYAFLGAALDARAARRP